MSWRWMLLLLALGLGLGMTAVFWERKRRRRRRKVQVCRSAWMLERKRCMVASGVLPPTCLLERCCCLKP